MAVYVYLCKECGYEFETSHSMVLDPYAFCPRCKKKGLVRRVTGGSGFVKVPGGASPGAAGKVKIKDNLPKVTETTLKRAAKAADKGA